MDRPDPRGAARGTTVSARSAAPLHLDASFLIRALDPRSAEASTLRGWLEQGRALAISALAWGEFLCGPLGPEEEVLAKRVVRSYVPIGVGEATEAARLFNQTGRRRGSFQDCLIAATAIGANAPLATADRADFERYRPMGLALTG